ncbi:MAG: hypothetical protein ACJA08_002954 [Cyclobacteriaceae bacterium]|jgi:hypothetical protein
MKFTFFLLTISTLAILSSCAKEKEIISALKYDGNTYTFSHSLQEDWGAHTGTHYNMDFTLVGEHTFFEKKLNGSGETYFTLSQEIDFYVFMELFDADTESFVGGNFSYLGDDLFEDVDDENVFRRLWFGTEEGEIFKAQNGSINLSIGTSGTYTISFQATLDNNKEIRGTFIGIPEYTIGR